MTTAVATTKDKPKTLRELLEGDGFRNQVARALPKHLPPDRFIRVAITAMTKTPMLAQCDQSTFFNALLTLSQLGLEPDGRRAHLIPFRNNNKGTVECQLIIDYKGLVELVMNTGQVSRIHADVVCEQDDFAYDRGQIVRHQIDFRKPRGDAYAAYALITFKDGTEKAEVMSKDEIEAIRKRSKAKESGPWVTDWHEMAKKTVFRRASKWVKLSPEQRDIIEADDNQYGFDTPGKGSTSTDLANRLQLGRATTETPEPEGEPEAPPPAGINIVDEFIARITAAPDIKALDTAWSEVQEYSVSNGVTDDDAQRLAEAREAKKKELARKK